MLQEQFCFLFFLTAVHFVQFLYFLFGMVFVDY
jgi:hypothetical protein